MTFKDQVLYDYAMSFVGVPYRWGGDDPMDGYDCSGFVIELMQSVGVFPRGYDNTSQGIFDFLKTRPFLLKPSFGCLSFYGRSPKQIRHVAFCLDDYRMIEAGGGDSTTINRDQAAEDNAFVRIRPIKYRADYIATILPDYKS